MRPIVTDHGFKFGAMTVEATASFQRRESEGESTVVSITTDAGVKLGIYCSPTGRSLRVFERGKGELRCTSMKGEGHSA